MKYPKMNVIFSYNSNTICNKSIIRDRFLNNLLINIFVSNFRHFLSDHLWIIFADLFGPVFSIVERTVVFIGVPVSTTERSATSTRKANDANIHFTFSTSVLLLLRTLLAIRSVGLRLRCLWRSVRRALLIGCVVDSI